jgi:hypothetical protein
VGSYANARETAARAIGLARGTGDRKVEFLALRLLALALAHDPDHADYRRKAVESLLDAQAGQKVSD